MNTMSKKTLFDIYQYIAPLVLTPTAFLLWKSTYADDVFLILFAVLIPILYAYVVPGIGTNVLKLWKFNAPLMLGNFRLHHGFMFGSATSVITWFVAHGASAGILEILTSAIVSGIVLASINTVYDIEGLKAGVIIIYTEPNARGASAEEIVFDYGPMVFGLFGVTYVGFLKAYEYLSVSSQYSALVLSIFFLAGLASSVAVPVLTYMYRSKMKYGHNGLHPVTPR